MANWIWLTKDKYMDNQSCDTSYHIHRANKELKNNTVFQRRLKR